MKGIRAGSLKTKIAVLFLVFSMVSISLVGYISYSVAKGALRSQFIQDMEAIIGSREWALYRYLKAKSDRVLDLSDDDTIIDLSAKISQRLPDYEAATEKLNIVLKAKSLLDPESSELFIVGKDGKVIASTDSAHIGTDRSSDPYFIEGKKGVYIKDVYLSDVTGAIGFAVAAPINDKISKELLGIVVKRHDLTTLNEIAADTTGMGRTGETYIVNKDSLMITKSRFGEEVILKRKIDNEPVRVFRQTGKGFSGVYKDYRNQFVVGSSMGGKINEKFNMGWLLIGEIDADEAFSPATKILAIILISAVILGAIALLLSFYISGSLVRPIEALVTTTEEVAKGDLNVNVSVASNDEIGTLAKGFVVMIENLKSTLAQVRDAVSQITSSSSEILAASQQQAAAAREQSSAVSETTSAATELSRSAESVGESIKRVAQAAGHALIGMAKVKDTMTKTSQIVASLSEKSQKISQITELIDDVADQTNLLAVNASIEAARAGEEGRGFTVVADEIRKLADSTAKSTKDITALIEVIQNEMSNAIMSMEQNMAGVEEEVQMAKETAEQSKEIAMSATQQVSGSKQIAEAMGSLNEAMKQISTGAQQSQVAAKQLSHLSEELKATVDKFKVPQKA